MLLSTVPGSSNPDPIGTMRDEVKELRKIFARLREGIAIVEGKKDIASLQKLGIEAVTYREIPEIKPEKEVFILTDLDREGERLLKEIMHELMLRGLKPNTVMRKKLGYLLKLRRFEEIAKKVEKMEVKLWEKLI